MKNIQFSYSEEGVEIVNVNINFEASLLTIAEPLFNALQEKLSGICQCNCCDCETQPETDPCEGKYFNVTCDIPVYNSMMNGVEYPYDGYIKPIINIDNQTEVTVNVQMENDGMNVGNFSTTTNSTTIVVGEITGCVFASDNCPYTAPEFVKCDLITVKISNGCFTKIVTIKITGEEIVTIDDVDYIKVQSNVTIQ